MDRFREELARIVIDPAIRAVAFRRAGSRALAEDALQETYWAVVRVKNPEEILDRKAFFRTSLIREINHQRARAGPVLDDDIAATLERGHGTPSIGNPPDSVEHEVALRLLGERLLERLKRDRDQLMASVPGRSPDPRRYRTAILATARAILLLLLEGPVASADWNAVLREQYPRWCAEPGVASWSIDQRLSRARSDVKALLKKILPRNELG